MFGTLIARNQAEKPIRNARQQKRIVRSYRKLRGILGRVKRYVFPPRLPTEPADTLAQMFGGKLVVVVKVGANDGLQDDPIAGLIRQNPNWRVVFIEPLPHIFRRLTVNYPPLPNYTFENIAISQKRGVRRMFYISDDIRKTQADVPFWYDQLGSFDRNHILKFGFDEAFLTSEEVPCEPLIDVLARNGIAHIDLLHIDVEGYDFEVIKQLDLKRHAPAAILYEYIHLTESDKMAAEKLLRRAGYRIQCVSKDALAILRR